MPAISTLDGKEVEGSAGPQVGNATGKCSRDQGAETTPQPSNRRGVVGVVQAAVPLTDTVMSIGGAVAKWLAVLISAEWLKGRRLGLNNALRRGIGRYYRSRGYASRGRSFSREKTITDYGLANHDQVGVINAGIAGFWRREDRRGGTVEVVQCRAGNVSRFTGNVLWPAIRPVSLIASACCTIPVQVGLG